MSFFGLLDAGAQRILENEQLGFDVDHEAGEDGVGAAKVEAVQPGVAELVRTYDFVQRGALVVEGEVAVERRRSDELPRGIRRRVEYDFGALFEVARQKGYQAVREDQYHDDVENVGLELF